MNGGLIIHPSAAPSSVDTEKWDHVGRKGDLTIELHTGDFGPPHGKQPALFIYKNTPDRGAFIPLPDMWMYAEKDALHKLIPPIAARIYGFVIKDDLIRILDAILDYLDELRKAPPSPKFRHKSLDAFLESCEEEGLSMFVDINGERLVG